MRPEIKKLVEQLLPQADDAALIDFESYYDDEVCTVKKLGPWAYSHHDLFDAYLVTIIAKMPDGSLLEFVGHPSEAPWHLINGRRWLAHNAPFDAELYTRMQEIGAAPPDVNPSEWTCTADLSAFFGYDRGLEKVSRQLFGIILNKDVRNVTMKGKYWFQFSDDEKKSVLDYAADDAIAWCVWQTLKANWPEAEQKLSRHTRESGSRGVRVDVDRMNKDIQTLEMMKFRLEQDIPWLDDEDEKGKPYKLGSPRALARECDKAGVPVPETTSVKDKKFQDWIDEYGEQVPAVEALVKHRRVQRQLTVYKTLRDRLRPDNTVESSLKYYGAQATGRWAGGSGLNFQNFLKAVIMCDAEYRFVEDKKAAVHKVDIRACFIAREGKKLIIADLSQIEPRVLNWVIGNDEFIRLLASGMGPYEAHARASMGWTGGNLKKENPAVYALAKARVLALGYGAGWRKFISMAAQYVGPDDFKTIFEAPVTDEQQNRFLEYLTFLASKGKETKRDLNLVRESMDPLNQDPPLTRAELNIWVNSFIQVMDFRDSNPKIAAKKNWRGEGEDGIWQQLDKQFRAAVTDGTYELGLPSGRSLYYFSVSSSWGWSCRRTREGMPERCYGGLITENMTQAIARDIFAHGVLNIEQAGHPVLFHVHDEVIVEVEPHVTVDEVVKLLTTVPDWATGLPVGAEAVESQCYLK